MAIILVKFTGMRIYMSKKQLLFAIIIFFFIVILVVFFVTTKEKNQPNCLLLNAYVELNNGKITITNNDTFDYVGTELCINNHYKLIGFNLIAGESTTLWQVEFSNYFRSRMSAKEKASSFSIIFNINNGNKGVFYVNLNKKPN